MYTSASRAKRAALLVGLAILASAPACVVWGQQPLELQIVPEISQGARIWTDRQVYAPDDPITVYFSVQQQTRWVKIEDFDVNGNVHELTSVFPFVPQQVMPGQQVTAFTARVGTQGTGTETLVLCAQTMSGQVVSAGCTFAVQQTLTFELQFLVDPVAPGSGGGVGNALRIGFNPQFTGCGDQYRIGQTLQVFLYMSQPGTYGLYNVTRYGTLKVMIAPRYFSAGTHTLTATVTGVPGTNTAVLHGTTSSGLTLNTYCSMNVTY